MKPRNISSIMKKSADQFNKETTEAILKSEKMTSLLKELQAAKKYETCKYHVVDQPGMKKGWFFLIQIETKTIVRDGTSSWIKSYLRLRKIESNVVFDYEKLDA